MVVCSPSEIIVSDNLFRQYSCLEYQCSRCCWKTMHWNIFTPEQYKSMASISSSDAGFGQELPISVNGKNHAFYAEDNTDKTCRHLDANKCGIHEYNPIHCALPLIKFKRGNRKWLRHCICGERNLYQKLAHAMPG